MRRFLLIVLMFFGALPVYGQTDALKLKKIHTYSFERGYYNTFLEVNGDIVGLVCPNLNRIYLVNIEKKTIDDVQFSKGRGPGEVSRGPFGIALMKEKLYMGDTDSQRFIVYNFKTDRLKTNKYQGKNVMKSIYGYPDNKIMMTTYSTTGIGYFIYDASKDRILHKYKFDKPLQNNFRVDGVPAISGRYLVHANYNYGDLYVWRLSDSELYKKSTVIEFSETPQTKKAKMGDMVGTIPPQNVEVKLVEIANNPVAEDRIFLLMKGEKDQNYETNYVYDYNFLEGEIVGKYAIDAYSTLIASNSTDLFAYSEERDKLYQYRIEVIKK
ncbi:hypothetical protein [Fodinibius halophilus]|uniref:6-bladed beta-propeller n=1 Tax=Fodinibius halophilus TaxID=1736908 RepID=A0A6M1TAW3_9BACT|nr:hypothetical protein [Fodinibius halophilus]NGP88104.1 hypothetical protein [Fodinibius halophilus]